MFADRLVAVSRSTAEVLADGLQAERLATIHTGIDVGRVKAACAPEGVRRALGLDPNALLLGTAGRLAPVKGRETSFAPRPTSPSSGPTSTC